MTLLIWWKYPAAHAVVVPIFAARDGAGGNESFLTAPWLVAAYAGIASLFLGWEER